MKTSSLYCVTIRCKGFIQDCNSDHIKLELPNLIDMEHSNKHACIDFHTIKIMYLDAAEVSELCIIIMDSA